MNCMTIGLPRLHQEQRERRDFLPSLVKYLDQLGATDLVLEHDYGEGMGFVPADYLRASPRVRFASFEECVAQDVVVMLRCPSDERLRLMRPGAVLVAMLHLDSRPGRVSFLRTLELQAVSLDLVRDDLGRRLVENLRAVAMNGLKAASAELLQRRPGAKGPSRALVRVTILGAGAVGAEAARAAVCYGDPEGRARLFAAGAPAVEVTLLDHELSADETYLGERLARTEMLVDATRRPDPSKRVVPNALLARLPEHAVVLDLAGDPYDFGHAPPRLKAVEGVPHGDLDQWVFHPGDAAFDALDPRVERAVQRVSLSCNAWPGLEPLACMEVYSKQIEPVLRAVLQHGVRGLDPVRGTMAERAVARATLSRWEATP